MKQRNRSNIFNNKGGNDMSNLKLVTTENLETWNVTSIEI